MFKSCSLKGMIFTSLLMAFAMSCMPAQASTPPANERVFVGRLISTTLRPTHNLAAERAFAKAHPRMVSINLSCASARTVYAVITEQGDTTDHMVVHSVIGEFCDWPVGMDGNPALIDVVRDGNEWRVKQAFEFEISHDDTPVLMPGGDAMVCGIRLWDLRSPLTPQDMGSDVEQRKFTPTRLQSLITQGVVRKDSEGYLVYTSAIGMQDLLKALAASPCYLRPSDTE